MQESEIYFFQFSKPILVEYGNVVMCSVSESHHTCLLCPGAGSVMMRLRRVDCVGDHQWVETYYTGLQHWYSKLENAKIGTIIYTSSASRL